MYSLYENAERYDQMYSGTDDLSFWIEEASRIKGTILELACGTGRLAIPLALEGHEVTGIDNSGAMLHLATRKAEAANVRTKFVAADIRRFSLGKEYGLIFIANNTFLHLLSDADAQDCLECARRHLAPNGRFAIDIFVPSMSKLLGDGSKFNSFRKYQDPDRVEEIDVSESSSYDSTTKIKHIRWRYEGSQSGFISEESIDLRMLFPDELESNLRSSGFRIEEKYGDYGRQPFGPNSPKQIVVASCD
jgi:ubiquinone/menaquinone biosynthesis C-methylase UbiE